MKGKQRLSASVDADLMQAGQEAVAEGRAESMSAWVNDALRLKADHDRRMRALDEFIAAYEAEHGEITSVSKIRHRVPVEDYLKPQKRFAHLFGANGHADMLAKIQADADRNIRRFGLLDEVPA